MSMLRQQALLCSSPSSISKFHFSPVHLPYSRSSQAERERKMESVEFSFARHQGGFVDDGDADVTWAVEKGSCFGGEEFLVDDFLDLGELETEGDEEQEEKEVENQEDEEEEKQEEEEEEAVAVAMREKNKSYCSSALTFEVPPPFPPPVSDFSLPAHDDLADLEWVSRVVDDSFSEVPTYVTHHQLQPQAMAQAPPPPFPPAVPVKARRSKRARTLSGSWSSSSYSSWDEGGPLVLLDSSAFSSTTAAAAASSATSSCSSSSYSSSQLFSAHQLFDEIPLHPSPPPPSKSPVVVNKKPKKRGRKPKVASADGITATAAANNGGGGERRCSHCGVNKTPQWRTGPMGAKSLCNACGVRYKSGRLLPEYRPACSPTFISHVHSNSHRKVLEMRRKEEEKMEKRQQHRQNFLLVSSATPVASF